jgi:flagellar motor switch protein FliG
MNDAYESPTENLTKLQKLAVLLLVLGPESAAEILRHFEEKELEAISAEMVKFNFVSQELQAAVLRDFAQVAVEAGTSVTGGVDFVSNTLTRAVGQFRAANIVNRVAKGVNATMLRPILEADMRELFNLIRHEQPQTIALLVSYFPPEKASELLAFCTAELRDQVVERLATLAPTPIEVLEKLVAVLTRKLSEKTTRALSRSGGVQSAAMLLNKLGRDTSKTVLTSLEERNPDLCSAIRKKMFTFEDMNRLDAAALQKVLREVDTRDLALALKKAAAPLQALILGGVSKRAAETVREEMSFLGSVKLKEVEEAQTRIIDVVRSLESEGEIELDAGEEAKRDEVMA